MKDLFSKSLFSKGMGFLLFAFRLTIYGRIPVAVFVLQLPLAPNSSRLMVKCLRYARSR
jgi:hypothetical protein